jgi:hypothetical protein
MTHLTEEQITLVYYGEGDEVAAWEQHLAACEQCRADYRALQMALNLAGSVPVPDRGPGYGHEVWERIRWRVPARRGRLLWSRSLSFPKFGQGALWGGRSARAGLPAPPLKLQRRPSRLAEGQPQDGVLPHERPSDIGSLWPRRLALAGAMAALLLGAFLAGRWSPRPAVAPGATASDVRERVLLVALGDYLERSEMVLVELVNAPEAGATNISLQQAAAEELVAENRLLRAAAGSAGETTLTGTLEELERVLLEIAHSPAEIGAPHLAEIRRRIEAEGILFKIRVLDAGVRNPDAAPAAPKQETL